MTHLTEKDLTPSLDAKIEVQGSDNHPCGNEGNFKTGLLKYVAWRLEIHVVSWGKTKNGRFEFNCSELTIKTDFKRSIEKAKQLLNK
jgi:hypothetical protein